MWPSPSDTPKFRNMIIKKSEFSISSPSVVRCPEDNKLEFAFIGRSNVGKSSLINAFIGEDRNIVTEIAGTTRDSIYTRYSKFGFDFYLVDTAGIRRKNKVTEDLEFYSVTVSYTHLRAHET